MPTRKYSCDTTILLGEGANSKVYLGRDEKGKAVAVKRTNYSKFTRMQLLQLQREIRILAALSEIVKNEQSSPFVRLFDVQDTGSMINMVTEFVQGEDLDIYCARYASMAVPERIAKWIFYKVLDAVKELHENNYCHLDIKLENIKYNPSTNKIKLMDFGFAQETTSLTKQGRVPKIQTVYCGSVNYVSPEIVDNIPFDGKKADVWSLGVCLYAILTGKFPFDSLVEDDTKYKEIVFDKIVNHDYELPSYLSTGARSLIQSMLHPVPANRPSIESILTDLWFKSD